MWTGKILAWRTSYILLAIFVIGCGGAFSRVEHAQHLVADHNFADANIILMDVAQDTEAMSPAEQAVYHFACAEVAMGLGHDADALYHLSIAHELPTERLTLAERERLNLEYQARSEARWR